MSGRSAYVRKKKGETKEKDAQLQHQFQQVAARQIRTANNDDASVLARSTSDSSRHNTITYNAARSAASFSSSSSNDGRHTLPSIKAVNAGVTGIEKSALRAFMDSKSDKFRNKLASKFTTSKSESVSSSQSTRAETLSRAGRHNDNGNSFAFELPATPIGPQPAPRTRMIRTSDGLSVGIGYDGNRELGGRSRGGEETPIKRWLGGGKPAQPWNKLRKDPELWDPTGDTLVFFGHETHQSSRPPPSFRVSSAILEETESAFLTTILREGYTYNEYQLPPSPMSAPSGSMTSADSIGPEAQSRSFPGSTVLPLRHPKIPPPLPSPGLNKTISRGGMQPTPPISENTGLDREYPILHEIYFPAPINQSKTDTLRHHLTTRNFFALLLNKSLVGISFYQALSDLLERLEMYMPPDSDNAGLMIDYIIAKGFDDVRNDPMSAIGLLIWSEGESVRWQEGWREAFVNCAGMYNRISVVPECRMISPITRALLERANLELQVRIQQAEERLATFDLTDMWPVMSAQPPPAKAAFDRFRKFLVKFYETVYWGWPPQGVSEGDSWLTRDVAMRLQRDFGALYDYLVNRDLVWDEGEVRSGRKWNIVSNRGDAKFRADTEDLPITDIFVGFDNRNRFPHIPSPYPLVPESQPVSYQAKTGLFGNSKKAKTADERARERVAALAYSEATNIYVLGSEFVMNDLVENFTKFEKTDRPGEINPYDARRGRWILLYGILQVLATVSVDTPGLRWTADVSYFLNPKLRGTPPWRVHSDSPMEEATHEHSYCWTVARRWSSDRNGADGGGNAGKQRAVVTTQRHLIIQKPSPPGVLGDTISTRTSEENDDDARTEVVVGQRAQDWVNSGGEYGGANDTLPRGSQREKTRDWPMPPNRPPMSRREYGDDRGPYQR